MEMLSDHLPLRSSQQLENSETRSISQIVNDDMHPARIEFRTQTRVVGNSMMIHKDPATVGSIEAAIAADKRAADPAASYCQFFHPAKAAARAAPQRARTGTFEAPSS